MVAGPLPAAKAHQLRAAGGSVDRVQALHTDSITRLDAVRIARLFMTDADVRLVRARAENAGGSETDID